MAKHDQLSRVHFEKLSRICTARGGVLLSGTSRKAREIKVQCAKGHIWHPDLYNVLKGSWCSSPECVSERISERKVAPIRQAQVEKIQKIVAKRDGTWVSGDYVNNHTKVHMRCKNGHAFSITPDSLMSGTWCARCTGKFPKEEMLLLLSEHASRKGGRLLSPSYSDIKSKLKFQCGKGHEPWMATAESVLRVGTWCPSCAPNGVKLDLEKVREELCRLAANKGGKCISVKRSPSGRGRYQCLMQCSAGHRWIGSLDHLRSGVWCPSCNSPGVKEKICRAIFEWLTGMNFKKDRPSWLVNSRGRRMELDGYNKNLGLAFEYQGEQHSKFTPFFHQDHDTFLRRVSDDSEKLKLCAANGVDLVQVDISVPLEGLQKHVADLLIKVRPTLAGFLNLKEMDVDRVPTGKDTLLAEIRRIALDRGGECLSTQYVSANHRLRFRCVEGHVWSAIPGSIRQGTWCKACAGRTISSTKLAKRDTAELVRIITEKGGVYLGPGLNNKLKLLVKCSDGHQWETDKIRLLAGRWCQKCAAKKRSTALKLTIEDLRQTARLRGGSLISSVYTKSGDRYLWQCGKVGGHRWLATAGSVRKGSWCPFCAGRKTAASPGG